MSVVYTKDHLWIRKEGAGYRVGLSAYAQKELGEIVYLEPPPAGTKLVKGEPVGSMDSLKSTSDIYAPANGTVLEVNSALLEEGKAKTINADPLGEGWIFSMSVDNPAELDGLLSEADYAKHVG